MAAKTWRKVESSALTAAGVPEFTYVTDVQASSARRQHRLRDAERLEPRQLQALHREEQRSRQAPGRRSPAICRSARARGRSCRTAVNPNLHVRRHGVRALGDGRRRRALGEDGRRADDPGPRHRDPQARRGSRSPARSGAASSSSTTTVRCASCTPQALGERARLYPLRDAYQYNELGQYEATWGNTTYPNPPTARC